MPLPTGHPASTNWNRSPRFMSRTYTRGLLCRPPIRLDLSRLPTELWIRIFEDVELRTIDLLRVILANQALYDLAIRSLYSSVRWRENPEDTVEMVPNFGILNILWTPVSMRVYSGSPSKSTPLNPTPFEPESEIMSFTVNFKPCPRLIFECIGYHVNNDLSSIFLRHSHITTLVIEGAALRFSFFKAFEKISPKVAFPHLESLTAPLRCIARLASPVLRYVCITGLATSHPTPADGVTFILKEVAKSSRRIEAVAVDKESYYNRSFMDGLVPLFPSLKNLEYRYTDDDMTHVSRIYVS
ncbi:hypothetical protein BDQ12DRAFT_685256 [Crucibulum laeve]|uniref:F-box domain-containing protein n=1 Tax=Crucibulum laeve TaxID=68775 RepID=A0A5C3LXU7_9AGAR|nr:hypothetical protein BDQ12DRAFT_685256 [Crucibulum laeve]